jgi:hypothetical protein
MHKTITILIILLILCTVGYWFLPSYYVEYSGMHYLANSTDYVIISELADHPVFVFASFLFVYPPIFAFLSRKKPRRLLTTVAINLLLLLFIALVFWGGYTLDESDSFTGTDHGSMVYHTYIGLWLIPVAVLLNISLVVLSFINWRKQKLLTANR